MTESPKDVAREAGRGRSNRTPVLALSGVTITIASVVCLVLIVVFLLYYLT
jgi:hypothetical protein